MFESTGDEPQISFRKFASADANEILAFLNRSYESEWGTGERWHWLFTKYPQFSSDNLFILNDGARIVGHRGMVLRDLVLGKERIRVAFCFGTAVHSEYRRRGLFKRLHDTSIYSGKMRGAAISFSTSSSDGTITNRFNRNDGFVEIRQSCYAMLLNPGRVLRSQLKVMIAGNDRTREALQGMNFQVRFTSGDSSFSLAEILEEGGVVGSHMAKGLVEVKLGSAAFPLLARLREGSMASKVIRLASLIIARRVRVSFSSPGVFFRAMGAAIRSIA